MVPDLFKEHREGGNMPTPKKKKKVGLFGRLYCRLAKLFERWGNKLDENYYERNKYRVDYGDDIPDPKNLYWLLG